MDLREAGDTRKRCQEYTDVLYKKYPHDPDNQDGVITHLEPNLLECEVKWSLWSITMNKTSGGDGIPTELFQIWKRWICESAAVNISVNLENSAVATGLEKISFHFNHKKGNVKECSDYHTFAFTSHASKVMCKILQARHQQWMNGKLPDVQAGFRIGRGTRDQIANICWIIDKVREFQENIYFFFIDYAKTFDWVDHNKLWKFL